MCWYWQKAWWLVSKKSLKLTKTHCVVVSWVLRSNKCDWSRRVQNTSPLGHRLEIVFGSGVVGGRFVGQRPHDDVGPVLVSLDQLMHHLQMML